ncbi:hypothetical protein NP233_g433 [Leucocoprinus birnbaumii]|uniref:Uncharacterized protein n=1 Tax=Leucocoprinus birnbaumii TaxID=56174 RepID=A0AAD5W1T2_9AGAR|nr:hypothetical protein NP233_g433 [Leucocoprinus birnbaumii]
MSASPEHSAHFSFDIDFLATGLAPSPHPDVDPFVSGSILLPAEDGNIGYSQSTPVGTITPEEPAARVFLYDYPHDSPREYLFEVKDGHFSLFSSPKFLKESRLLESEYEVFDPLMDRFIGLPTLAKWECPSAKSPFLIVKSAGLPQEDCAGLSFLIQELDNAVDAFFEHVLNYSH